LGEPRSRSRSGTYSHAIPAMQQKVTTLIAGLVFTVDAA
jgi:hypothetical protein